MGEQNVRIDKVIDKLKELQLDPCKGLAVLLSCMLPSIGYKDESILNLLIKEKLVRVIYTDNGPIYEVIDIKPKEPPVDEWIKDYRRLFKGVPGKMGNPHDCLTKVKWVMEQAQATKEEVLKAAETYVNSVKDKRYLKQADYFAHKQDGNKKYSLSNSMLAGYITDLRDDLLEPSYDVDKDFI